MTSASTAHFLELKDAIDLILAEENNHLTPSEIQAAYTHIKEKYSHLKSTDRQTNLEEPLLSNIAQRFAYLLTRMPATFSVATTILNNFTPLIYENNMRSLLDLGSGTGAVIWAILNAQLNFDKITAIDQDPAILALAKKLAHYSKNPFWQQVQWLQKNITTELEIETHDIVSISYALIEQSSFTRLLDKMWDLANKALIIIEPGTPKGFANIHLAREYFIKKGGYIAAPCSHQSTCPIKNTNWCHFAERIERSAWQRSLKGASLGYEDEPYSYLIITKFPIQNTGQRILSPPTKRSGHIIIDLCAPHTIEKTTITRSKKAAYKIAKKKKWGDVLVV